MEVDAKLNRETTLETLYHYPVGAVVEYPETSSTGFVGHLFEMIPTTGRIQFSMWPTLEENLVINLLQAENPPLWFYVILRPTSRFPVF
jgi:hypothetical protein